MKLTYLALAATLAAALYTLKDVRPIPSTPEQPQALPQSEPKLLQAQCQLAAEKEAHDPMSVSWLRDQFQFFYTTADGKHAVAQLTLRARNAMNATVLARVRCEFAKAPNGTWHLSHMTQF